MKHSVYSLLLGLFLAAGFLTPLRSGAQDISGHTARKKQIESEIALIDRRLSDNRNLQNRQLNDLALTRRKIESRQALIRELSGEIRQYERDMLACNREIRRLSIKLDTLQYYYEDMLLKAYKTRDSKTWFLYLFASRDLEQGYRRWAYLKNFSGVIRSEAEKIRQTQAELETQQKRLASLKRSSESAKAEQEKAHASLTREERQVNQTIASLQRQEKKYRSDLAAKRKEVERLNREIERILAEAVRKDRENQSKGIRIDHALSEKFGNNRGKLPWPVSRGVVIEKFGQHNHPVFKHIKLPFNNGINISTDRNAEVYAIFDGVVKQVLIMPGYNQCVLVQHGEYFTFYCKLKQVSVKNGDRIAIGTPIGIVDDGDEGSVLHFQLWKGTEKQNPELWLSGNR